MHWRVESAGLIKAHAKDIGSLLGSDSALIEFGAGSIKKAQILFSENSNFTCYVPIDICEQFLNAASATLKQEHPEFHINPILGNFFNILDLNHLPPHKHRLGVLFGVTLGNFTQKQVPEFLRCARKTLGPNACLLVSLDILSDPESHQKAYKNDPKGIRKAFCDNLITRINKELNGNIQIDNFQYAAIWNPADYAIEMTYISQCLQTISIAGRQFEILPDEHIILKSSHKYPEDHALKLFREARYDIEKSWQDPNSSCHLYFLSSQPENKTISPMQEQPVFGS
ncbi:L-histidine N(alpha)-methyltransferase [Pseudovibrio sp. Tun.PSC04-5.I4]|uniref:L-histidine N(alpha)-methyltransferase n=1 Tax=Pseudovibrio sp. Tun.PSC04-5.I4 TaxID=1798213 RepID=UPI000B82038F|nr:L-histidine N(alpha)-methyltransferase [Pseudovibrio sp. Tun.PSC04-5.I4]